MQRLQPSECVNEHRRWWYRSVHSSMHRESVVRIIFDAEHACIGGAIDLSGIHTARRTAQYFALVD